LDLAFYQTLAVATTDRFHARFVLMLVQELVVFCARNRGVESIAFIFVRENKTKYMRFGPMLRLNGPSLIPALEQLDKTPQPVPELCTQCGVGHRVKRCTFCGDLRFCSDACRDAAWEASHKTECKVWAKKKAGMPQPPGGASVVKESNKAT
jgi:hypothetical protein